MMKHQVQQQPQQQQQKLKQNMVNIRLMIYIMQHRMHEVDPYIDFL